MSAAKTEASRPGGATVSREEKLREDMLAKIEAKKAGKK